MKTATIDYPNEVRLSLGLTDEQFVNEIRMMAAIKLFELGRLSSGHAAELAGISRIRFLHELERYGVTTSSLSEDDLLHDVANARPS